MITRVERTIEGVLIAFTTGTGTFTVLYADPAEAIRFASTVMGVAALADAADPAELLGRHH